MVDWGRLLSGCWVYCPTGGSNPPLPADKTRAKWCEFFCLKGAAQTYSIDESYIYYPCVKKLIIILWSLMKYL